MFHCHSCIRGIAHAHAQTSSNKYYRLVIHQHQAHASSGPYTVARLHTITHPHAYRNLATLAFSEAHYSH